eukprot:TRINITY_DN4208_c0_g1_i1.p1 TRINITY_DN4208_c0_g1~~TRINITY_DN4208_c0_g1_i1.p1  ORF type:complete len:473 (-),score=64.84 TRINITY_DN4208_c0_g1_i1:396-1814(-)
MRPPKKKPTSIWHGTRERELGVTPPWTVEHRVVTARTSAIELSFLKEIVNNHGFAINCLQVDSVEGRYLLTGASDGSLGVYDVQQPTTHDATHGTAQHEALFKVDKRNNPSAHRFAISSVQWYPVDTGLFVAASFDKTISVWDTNTQQAEVHFSLPGKVYGIAMSGIAPHMLVAAATEDARVRLCDIASGAFSHTLAGHRDAVWAVQWSVSSEWELATGGCDGAVRMWDIRRAAGCLLVLDQYKAATPGRGGRKDREMEQQRAGGSAIFGAKLAKSGVALANGKRTSGGLRQQGQQGVRVHPGAALGLNRATAHDGAVTAVHFLPDGVHLLSAGNDSRMRLWDLASGTNTLVNYARTHNRAVKGIPISLSQDGGRIYHPAGSSIQVYSTHTGELLTELRGHYGEVNACAFHSLDQELYSCAVDRQILVWSPPPPAGMLDDLAAQARQNMVKKSLKWSKGTRPDVDAWSDDDE